MPTDSPRLTPRGTLIMGGLLLGAIMAAAFPMIVGISLFGMLPGIGELKRPLPTVLLHVFWMYPVLWMVSSLVSAISTHVVGGRELGRVGTFVDGLITWWVITIMYTAIFHDMLGARLASLVTCLLLKPVVSWLERHRSGDEDPPKG